MQDNSKPPVAPNLNPAHVELNWIIEKLPRLALVLPSTVKLPTTSRVELGDLAE